MIAGGSRCLKRRTLRFTHRGSPPAPASVLPSVHDRPRDHRGTARSRSPARGLLPALRCVAPVATGRVDHPGQGFTAPSCARALPGLRRSGSAAGAPADAHAKFDGMDCSALTRKSQRGAGVCSRRGVEQKYSGDPRNGQPGQFDQWLLTVTPDLERKLAALQGHQRVTALRCTRLDVRFVP